MPKEVNIENITKAENKINEIYSKLESGKSFEKLALSYSNDKGSAKKGGVLEWFGTGRMLPEFETAAFNLKSIGDYTTTP